MDSQTSFVTNLEKWFDGINHTKRYTQAENELIKNLAFHPVFKYYQYRTFLKFLLISTETYHCIAKLHINKDAQFRNVDNGTQINLREAAANDDIERRNEIETVLKKMPEFKAFITAHGNNALKQILAEIHSTREAYRSKLKEEPHYQQIIDALDPALIKQRYEEVTDKKLSYRNNTTLFSQRKRQRTADMKDSPIPTSMHISPTLR